MTSTPESKKSPIQASVYRVPPLDASQASQWLKGSLRFIHPLSCNADTPRLDVAIQLCPPPDFGQGRLKDIGALTFRSLGQRGLVPFSD